MADWYYKYSGAWKLVNQAFFKDSSTWKEIQEAYYKDGGVWKNFYTAFVATSFTTETSNTTVTVPSGANAIHIRQAVGGGSSGVNGGTYDKVGGESGGSGGGSGAYISDKIFTVAEGETLTLTVGAGGVQSDTFNPSDPHFPNYIGDDGADTVITGSSTGSIATLGGSTAGGSVGGSNTPNTGPLRTNFPSVGGTATIDGTEITSGSFRESNGASVTIATATTLAGGPVGTFDQSGDGVAGVNGTNCGGDDCTVAGGDGGDSYNGNISGGTGNSGSDGTAGGEGAGGGGGGHPFSKGGNGGDGKIVYRFLRIN